MRALKISVVTKNDTSVPSRYQDSENVTVLTFLQYPKYRWYRGGRSDADHVTPLLRRTTCNRAAPHASASSSTAATAAPPLVEKKNAKSRVWKYFYIRGWWAGINSWSSKSCMQNMPSPYPEERGEHIQLSETSKRPTSRLVQRIQGECILIHVLSLLPISVNELPGKVTLTLCPASSVLHNKVT